MIVTFTKTGFPGLRASKRRRGVSRRATGYPGSVSSESLLCPVCGSAVPPEASFCPRCGHALDGDLETRHLFGVLAPGPTFVLGCVLLLGALVALLAGSPVAGIALAAFAGAAFVLFYGAAERDPASPVARGIMTSGRRARSWAAFVRESVDAWVHATRDLAKLRGESRSLREERRRALVELGDAAYREDEARTTELRQRLREIDEGLASRDLAQAATLAKARRHVHEERVAVQPTQQFSVEDLTSGGNSNK
jgi:hypothetical protein